MELMRILQTAMQLNGSDIFILPGSCISMKVNGAVVPIMDSKVRPEDAFDLVNQVYATSERNLECLLQSGDDDFSFSVRQIGRFRCNAYRQRNSYAMVLRVMHFDLPCPEKFHIPQEVLSLTRFRKGLILVTGPAGSGKSTTLACMLDRINNAYSNHIITIEDPIEFIHSHKRSLVSQREVAHDTMTYAAALRAALRQAPDVILLGEMRDFETIQTALTAAETGQLVLSSLHTVGAAKTIDRIIDVFPPSQQQQVRVQLSMVLQAVVSQQLVPTVDNQREPAFEIMVVNSAIRNMIREGKAYQMENVIFAGASEGMRTMDSDLLRLYEAGRISRSDALLYAANSELMHKKLELCEAT